MAWVAARAAVLVVVDPAAHEVGDAAHGPQLRVHSLGKHVAGLYPGQAARRETAARRQLDEVGQEAGAGSSEKRTERARVYSTCAF